MKFEDFCDAYCVNLAKLARRIGITKTYICDIKKGLRTPSKELRHKFAQATNFCVLVTDWPKPKKPKKRRSKALTLENGVRLADSEENVPKVIALRMDIAQEK